MSFSYWTSRILLAVGGLLHLGGVCANTPEEKKQVMVEPHPGETVDRYAERILKLRLLKQMREAEPKTMAAPTAAHAPRLQNMGEVGPGRFELVFIAGSKGQERAHLRIDGQYAKLVKVGEHIAGWHLVDIGTDFVDIAKDGESSRLYLFSQATPRNSDTRDRKGHGDQRGY